NASTRAAVQGFADVEIDGKWRLNGINLLRNGSIKSGQLTPLIKNRRVYIPSIEVLDPELRESLTAAIQGAIGSHLETLPPEQRMKLSEPRKPVARSPVVAASGPAQPAHARSPGRLNYPEPPRNP